MARLVEVCTAISGPPNRHTTSRRCPAWPLHYRTWPVFGPPTSCGTGHFWSALYFQMRRPATTTILLLLLLLRPPLLLLLLLLPTTTTAAAAAAAAAAASVTGASAVVSTTTSSFAMTLIVHRAK